MALTRKTLKAMGLTDEQVDSIIEAHSETVNGLKDEVERYKEEAEKVPTLQQKLEEAEQTVKDGEKDSWKVKYDAIKEEFETYKTVSANEKTKAARESTYREFLKSVGIAEKRIDAVMRVTDLGGVEFDENNKIKDVDKQTESVKAEWADFISDGAPAGGARISTGAQLGKGGGAKSKQEILEIKDRTERRKAIAENMSLFSKGE